MDTIGAFLDALSGGSLDKDKFLQANRCSFLVTIEVADALPGGLSPEGSNSSAATVAHDPQKVRKAMVAAREGKVYAIQKRAGANSDKDVTLGRSRDNDVWINDAEVSKHHAKLLVGANGAVQISDIGSTNGTFLNAKRIDNNVPCALKTYDSVQFGRAGKLQFLDAASFFDYLTVLRRFVGL
jgi:hypothetical protein